MILRDYQCAAVENLRAAFRSGKKRVILYSPTGSGKTVIGLDLIRRARLRNARVLFVCDRIELVRQASTQLFRAGISHGIIQGANSCRVHEPVLVASIQTLTKRGYPEADLIVIDEAHAAAGSRSYRELLEHFAALPIVGLTATPFSRGLGKAYDWGALFEHIVCAATIPGLIGHGHLVDVDIYAPTTPDLTGVRIVAGEYQQDDLGKAVDKPTLVGDIVTHWKRLAPGKSTVCFATNIAHSRHIVEQFTAAGIAAEHLDCYTDDAERKAILDRVAQGVTTVVSNVAILAEGWDQPCVEVMICARPTRSLIRWIQMAGRILRPYAGKTGALILDHSGSALRLGYPTADLPLELHDGTPKKSGTPEAKIKLPKICPKCQFLKPVGVRSCPQCGFSPMVQSEVETETGELVKLAKPKFTTADKERLFAELKSLAVTRGWSKGRLSHVFRDIIGVWPNAYMRATPRTPTEDTLRKVQHLAIRFAKRRQVKEESRSCA